MAQELIEKLADVAPAMYDNPGTSLLTDLKPLEGVKEEPEPEPDADSIPSNSATSSAAKLDTVSTLLFSSFPPPSSSSPLVDRARTRWRRWSPSQRRPSRQREGLRIGLGSLGSISGTPGYAF